MEEQKQAETRAKLAELRVRYARLLAICGPQAISRETREEYNKKAKALLEQLENAPAN